MLAVLNERKGTCSTKHALLKSLATRAGFADSADARNLRMNARNTLGIVHVLEKHQLPYIPEANCYLVHQDRRIDVSRNLDSRQSEAIVAFLLEEEITTEPDQRAQAPLASSIYGAMAEPRHLLESDLDRLWRIR